LRDELQIALRLARELPPEQLPSFLGQIEEIRCTAMARLTAPITAETSGTEELITIEEASLKLGVSADYLYRHKNEYSFTRRIGRKLLFSSVGIDRYIRRQDGLTAKRHRATVISS
jgi:hypothetical protein